MSDKPNNVVVLFGAEGKTGAMEKAKEVLAKLTPPPLPYDYIAAMDEVYYCFTQLPSPESIDQDWFDFHITIEQINPSAGLMIFGQDTYRDKAVIRFHKFVKPEDKKTIWIYTGKLKYSKDS